MAQSKTPRRAMLSRRSTILVARSSVPALRRKHWQRGRALVEVRAQRAEGVQALHRHRIVVEGGGRERAQVIDRGALQRQGAERSFGVGGGFGEEGGGAGCGLELAVGGEREVRQAGKE